MTLAGFDTGFDDAPFNDSAVAVGVAGTAWPFPVSIDGHPYVMDLAKSLGRTLAQFRQQSDTSREPGEQSLSIEGVWKRTGQGSQHGAGQRFYDDDTSDRNRYWTSYGIDPWTIRDVHLLPFAERRLAMDSTTPRVLVVDGYCFVVDGAALRFSLDPLAVDPDWTNQHPFGGGAGSPIESIATDGATLFLACGNSGLRTVTPGVTGGTELVNPVSLTPSLVVYANGWLIATTENSVKSVAQDGTVTGVFDHRRPGFVWNCGTSAPNAIYLGGNAGDRAEIYRTTVNESGSALATPIFAGDLPAGERIWSIAYYSGLMLLGTSKGLRLATIDNDGGLSVGAVIEDVSGQGCRCIDARGQYAWFGYVNAAHSNRRGLARANLARFTEENVPAFSPDLESDETGGRTTSVATWVAGDGSEHRLFCVSDSGLFVQRDELVEEGLLDLGWLGMGSPESKTLSSVSLAHDALQGTITMEVENEHGVTVEAEQVEQSTYESTEIQRSVAGELLDVRLVLRRSEDDDTVGPHLRRWTVRVVPAPASVDEFIVTLLWADLVEDTETQTQRHYDPFAEYRFLKQIENDRRVVTFRLGQATYLVTVRSVGWEGAEDWSSDRRFLDTGLQVRMVTLEGVPPRLPGDVF